MQGLRLEHVAAGVAVLSAVLGNQVDVASIQLGEAIAQIKAGKVTPVVTFAKERVSYLPDTPTATEAGFPAEVQQSRAIVATKGTPKEILDELRAAAQKAFDKTLRYATERQAFGPSTQAILDEFTQKTGIKTKQVAVPEDQLATQPTVSDQGGHAMSEVEKQPTRPGAQSQAASRARAVEADFADGAWFVSLGALGASAVAFAFHFMLA